MSETDPSLRGALKGQLASTSRGEWDLYAAFIERASEWLSPDGVAGLVVPSRWLTSATASGLRGTLAAKRAVRAVLDFGTVRVFRSATTYASTVFLAGTAGRRWAPSSWKWLEFATAWLRRAGCPSGTLDSRPWPLAVGQGATALETMRTKRRGGSRKTLGELATIAKGTGTNADKVFVLPDNETLAQSRLVRPCIRGRDVSPLGTRLPMRRLLYPYDETTRLIDPSELHREYPAEATYLGRHRERLEAREGGRFCRRDVLSVRSPSESQALAAPRRCDRHSGCCQPSSSHAPSRSSGGFGLGLCDYAKRSKSHRSDSRHLQFERGALVSARDRTPSAWWLRQNEDGLSS